MRIRGITITLLSMILITHMFSSNAMVCNDIPQHKENVTQLSLKPPLKKQLSESQPITPTVKVRKPQPPDLDIPLNDDLKGHIYELCGYDDDLYCFITAVIEKESQFDEQAVSADGHDHGLMQLRDSYYNAWCEKYNVSDPKEPYDNVTVGVSLLAEFLEKYEYKNLALMCYNCGEAGARKLWKQGIYSTDYTVKVLNSYETYLAEAKEQ